MSERAANIAAHFARAFVAILVACALWSLASTHAAAQQVPAAVKPPEVTVALSDDNVELGDSLVYQITIDGVSSADPPTLPRAGGARVDFLGGHDESSRSIMTINGRTTETSVLRYIMQWKVTPDHKGQGAIDGFTLDIGGHKTNVPRVQFTVNEPKPNPNFKLTLESDATNAYVGEPVRMRLVWLLGNAIQSASFSGSDGGSNFDVAAIDPRGPQARGKQLLQNEPYRVVPFLNSEAIVTQSQAEFGGRPVPRITLDLVVTPRQPGRIEVGPFRVALDELVGRRSMMDSIFSGNNTKRSVVTSNALTLDVKPLPAEGKPADFGGLVGVFTVESKAGNTEANVGDPIPLTLTISGPEPLEALKPPNLELQQNFASEFKSAPEGWETSTTVVAAPGERTFTTTIRPKSAQITEIPAIRLPYFDTKTGKYAVAMSKPIPLKVRTAREFTAADALHSGGSGFSLPTATASTLTSAPAGVGANSESLDALRDQRVGLLAAATAPTGFALLLIPPTALVIAIIAAWKSQANDPERAKRRQAIREGKRALASAHTPAQVLAAARIGLAPFVGAKAEAVASSDPDGADLPVATAIRAKELLQRLEGAAFDGVSVDVANAKTQTHELLAMLNP